MFGLISSQSSCLCSGFFFSPSRRIEKSKESFRHPVYHDYYNNRSIFFLEIAQNFQLFLISLACMKSCHYPRHVVSCHLVPCSWHAILCHVPGMPFCVMFLACHFLSCSWRFITCLAPGTSSSVMFLTCYFVPCPRHHPILSPFFI